YITTLVLPSSPSSFSTYPTLFRSRMSKFVSKSSFVSEMLRHLHFLPFHSRSPCGRIGGHHRSYRRLPLHRRSSRCRSGSQAAQRSEEHTSELHSRGHLVCRRLLDT